MGERGRGASVTGRCRRFLPGLNYPRHFFSKQLLAHSGLSEIPVHRFGKRRQSVLKRKAEMGHLTTRCGESAPSAVHPWAAPFV